VEATSVPLEGSYTDRSSTVWRRPGISYYSYLDGECRSVLRKGVLSKKKLNGMSTIPTTIFSFVPDNCNFSFAETWMSPDLSIPPMGYRQHLKICT
jgi:hypothetical protein